MTTIIATIIVLGVLIFVHELGHFWAAKVVDVEVERFSIGFGPRVWGFRWGETEYILAAIPLGGYVKMGGMEDEVMEHIEGGPTDEEREPGPRDFDAKPVWARTFVISAGVIMNMLFAYAGYTAAIAIRGEPVLETDRVGSVQVDRLPEGAEALAEIPPGATIRRIGSRTIDDWRDVQDGLAAAEPGALVIEIENPDRLLEIEVPESRAERRRMAAAVQSWIDPAIAQVVPGSPADRAELEEGDRILAVEGEPISSWYDFVEAIRTRPGEATEVRIERDGSELVRVVTPDQVTEQSPDGTGRTQIGQIGVVPRTDNVGYRRVSAARSIALGAQETWATTVFILDFLVDLVTGDVSPRSVGSIVTIGEASGEFFAQGMVPFVRFMALFSINLAILNLLPIPVLDGGHLVFLGIEAVRGRAVSVEQKLRWSQIGFFIILGLMIWALSNDVLRLLGM